MVKKGGIEFLIPKDLVNNVEGFICISNRVVSIKLKISLRYSIKGIQRRLMCKNGVLKVHHF